MNRLLVLCAVVFFIPSIRGFGDERPKATLSQEEIHKRALACLNAIKSIDVEYEVKYGQLREVAGIPDQFVPPPFQIVFASKADKRLFRQVYPVHSYPPTALVFDGKVTADIRYSVDGNRKPQMKTVFLQEGKSERCDDQELYCTEVVGLLLSRRQANAETSSKYPYCLGNKVAQNIKGTRYEFRVLPHQELVDGAWCHVVESPLNQCFWIDTTLGCALRKRERPSYETALYSDFVKVADGVWLPRKFVGRFLAIPEGEARSVPYKELRIAVKTVSINSVHDRDFQIRVPKGTDICDLRDETMQFLPKSVNTTPASLADDY